MTIDPNLAMQAEVQAKVQEEQAKHSSTPDVIDGGLRVADAFVNARSGSTATPPSAVSADAAAAGGAETTTAAAEASGGGVMDAIGSVGEAVGGVVEGIGSAFSFLDGL